MIGPLADLCGDHAQVVGALYGSPVCPAFLRVGGSLHGPVDLVFAAFPHLRDFGFCGRIKDRDGPVFRIALHKFTIDKILVAAAIGLGLAVKGVGRAPGFALA